MEDKALTQGLTPAIILESIKTMTVRMQLTGFVAHDKHRFERFINSYELRNYLYCSYKIHADFARLRRYCSLLIKAGELAVRREVGHCTRYSVWEFEGYTAQGNYFVQN